MKHEIINFLKTHGGTSIHRLSLELGISRQMIHRHMSTLIDNSLVEKRGQAPKVLYVYKAPSLVTTHTLSEDEERYLEQSWLTITPIGKRLEGAEGFSTWCMARGLDPRVQFVQYKKIHDKYEAMRDHGFFDATSKFRDSFTEDVIDKVFYMDFYSIEVFGKTKLGQLLLHAKLAQDRKLISELALYTAPYLSELIQRLNIDAYAVVPHSLRRSAPLLPGLKERWGLQLAELPLIKVTGAIPVAQKTLSKMQDRVENARETIYVDDGHAMKVENLLLIDDAVGSGSTFQETAKKIRSKGLAKHIYALALVGSLKGFEVVREV